jgi:hypothetical protein
MDDGRRHRKAVVLLLAAMSTVIYGRLVIHVSAQLSIFYVL